MSCVFYEWEDGTNQLIDFILTVPPSIVDEGTVLDTKVKERHNITLTCEASGNSHEMTPKTHLKLCQ